MDNKIIMLVEDNPNDEALTIRALKKSNDMNEIVVARDGVEALNYLFGEGSYSGRDAGVMPDLILLDLKLPQINGLEVLKRIRTDERTKLVPVVILTSSKERRDLTECYELGANSYIRKTVDFVEFRKTMELLGLYWLVFNVAPETERMHESEGQSDEHTTSRINN
jgi:two-component system response regulator